MAGGTQTWGSPAGHDLLEDADLLREPSATRVCYPHRHTAPSATCRLHYLICLLLGDNCPSVAGLPLDLQPHEWARHVVGSSALDQLSRHKALVLYLILLALDHPYSNLPLLSLLAS